MFRPNRCQICGETYLGTEKPDRCPYCGSDQRHIVMATEWVDHGKVDLSEQSYKDCERSIELELDNMAFYKCSAAKTKDQVMESFFKRLSKHEGEHAELLAEMMGIEEPDPPEVSCSDDDRENMAEAHRREKRAILLYQAIANRAPEARMQEVFRALTDIESEHLIVSSTYR